MNIEWKVGDKCKIDGEYECVIRHIENDEACVFYFADDALQIVPLDDLSVLPPKPKLPTGEVHVWNDGGIRLALWRDEGPGCPHHTIDLRRYWLMEVFVELVEEGRLYLVDDGHGVWRESYEEGMPCGEWSDWRSAVLDLRPDLREALGGEA